jgi:hypothetical protein
MQASDDNEFMTSYWKDPRAYQGHSMIAKEYFQGFQDSMPKEAFSEQYMMQ